MKKNRRFFAVVLAILTGLVFAAVFSCGDGGGRSVSSETFTGTDEAGIEYELTVTGADYVLKIDGKIISTGAVSKNGDLWTLMPNGVDGDAVADFDVTIDGIYIAEIGGKITPDQKGGTPIIPGVMVPPVEPAEPEDGPWIWYAMDDSVPNDYLNVQTVFAPGGASRITNAKKVTNPDGTKGQKPFKHAEGTVKDNEGKTITEPVFNFTGNTKVSKDNRGPNETARFPMVGWGAKPNPEFPETLKDLRSAKGYSFWVRLNSSTASNWVILTAVDSAFDEQGKNDREKGYEHGHWFGNKAGGSNDGKTKGKDGSMGINNLTSGLELGKWHKITVIMSATGRNIEQAWWIHQYNPEYKRPFNQNKAEQIQWQIPLQYQKDGTGEAERSEDPYDVIKGSYDFNLDFYGLELIK